MLLTKKFEMLVETPASDFAVVGVPSNHLS